MQITVKKSYKYRIYPTKAQRSTLENQFSMCRCLYNFALNERIEAYKTSKKTISYCDQALELPKFKQERPWYKSVYSQVLQDVLKRLDKAYQSFFRRVKAGETAGFPKFKKRGRWNSIVYPQYTDLPSSRICVPKVGETKLVMHRTLPQDAKVKTLTILKEGSTKWFACFSVEQTLNVELKQTLPSIGIDMGLIDFVHISNSFQKAAPKFFRKLQDKLAILQKKFSNAKKCSPIWYKFLRKIQDLHYKIRCQRHDFLHKIANELLEQADTIICEDLNIAGMSRRPKPKQNEQGKFLPNGASRKSGLNKSIADAGWGQFLNILKYKAVLAGKTILAVPAHYTSQTCPKCGNIVKKSLAVRAHVCSCGFVANRDFAASLNILRIGMDTLAEVFSA